VGKFLTGAMQLVYLDQCAISRFVPKPGNEAWRELRDAIIAAHSRNRLLCPNSLEHLVETAAMNDSDAVAVDKVIRLLSNGWSLVVEPRLIARQIFCAIKGMRMSRGQFLHKGLFRPLTHLGSLKVLRELKAEMDRHNEWLMQGVNEINAITRDGKRGGTEMLELMIDMEVESITKAMTKAVTWALENSRAEVLPSKYRETCRDWPSTVVYTLVKEHGFRSSALRELYRRLRSEGISFIPMLEVKSRLLAFQFFQKQKVEARDQYDITRISCVLPYADVLVTDGEKAHAIQSLQLDKQFNVKVFSMRKDDVPKLIEHLKHLARDS
jgi:hypothetical protein